jgi:thiol-disulfide isomerase/thioredoxin
VIIQSATRRNFLAGLGVTALLAATPARQAKAESLADASLADRWSQFRLIDSQNTSFTIGNVRKPLTLIGFWASWCPVCVGEYGQIAALQESVGAENMDVIMMSHPNWWEDDLRMAKSRGMTFRMATADPSNGAEAINETMTDNGDYFVPRTLVFRRDAGELSVVMSRNGRLNLTDGSVAARLRGAMV